MPAAADDRAVELFARTFGGVAGGVVRAPGRLNVIGDHTDYNGGFVLPIALDRDVGIAFRRRDDGLVRLVSEHGPDAEFSLTSYEHVEQSWADYVRGVGWALDVDSDLGWEGAIASDVPIGAGLSSSAALEIGSALVFESLRSGTLDRVRLAELAQRAENEWVGMDCGIMDQLSVATATSRHALLIDCRTLKSRHVPVPLGVAFVVLDTMTRRTLTDSSYNERRATCEAAATALGVSYLGELGPTDLLHVDARLDERTMRRVRHVVTENARVVAAADAMADGDLESLGRLMTESHESLRDDFEVSTSHLDAIVSAAVAAPGALGARVTGAGFGGCAVALVEVDAVASFTALVESSYRAETGLDPQVYPTLAAQGASIRERPDGG